MNEFERKQNELYQAEVERDLASIEKTTRAAFEKILDEVIARSGMNEEETVAFKDKTLEVYRQSQNYSAEEES